MLLKQFNEKDLIFDTMWYISSLVMASLPTWSATSREIYHVDTVYLTLKIIANKSINLRVFNSLTIFPISMPRKMDDLPDWWIILEAIIISYIHCKGNYTHQCFSQLEPPMVERTKHACLLRAPEWREKTSYWSSDKWLFHGNPKMQQNDSCLYFLWH
jgi:hypothetical protein